MEFIIIAVIAFVLLVIVRGGPKAFAKRYYNPNFKRPPSGYSDWEEALAVACDNGYVKEAEYAASKLSDDTLKELFETFAETYYGIKKYDNVGLTERELKALPLLYTVTKREMYNRRLQM